MGAFATAGTFEAEAWVNFSSLPSVSQLFAFNGAGGSDGIAVFTESNTLIADAKGTTASGKNATIVFSTGHWYHIVIQKTTQQVNKIYVNGVDVTTTGTDYVLTNSAVNYLGIYDAVDRYPLAGIVDEVRVSNTNRSAD